jgi:hypothetical protein
VARPRKYHTQEERREARRQSYRKHYLAHREAIKARQVERDRKRRAAMKAGQKEPIRGDVKTPAPLSRGREGWRGGKWIALCSRAPVRDHPPPSNLAGR